MLFGPEVSNDAKLDWCIEQCKRRFGTEEPVNDAADVIVFVRDEWQRMLGRAVVESVESPSAPSAAAAVPQQELDEVALVGQASASVVNTGRPSSTRKRKQSDSMDSFASKARR